MMSHEAVPGSENFRHRPRVSVIIPVLDDVEGLERCLASLAAQTYPAELVEILVVDNGSTRDVRSAAKRYPRVTVLEEAEPSSYAARNRGVRSASGELLAFTDADCLPEPEWIENAVGYFVRDAELGMVGGRIEIFPEDESAPSAVELFETVGALPQDKFLKNWHFAATANMMTSRRVFDRIGGFCSGLKSGGDVDWGGRVYAAGLRQVYAGDAVVRHPARRTLRQLVKRARRIQGGVHDIRVRRGEPVWLRLVKLPLEWPLCPNCWTMMQDKRLRTMKQRVRAYFAMRVFKYARVAEGFRLLLGGRSARA